MRTSTFVGLLRGINVSGTNKVLMRDLRSLCEELGWAGVQTYIQSGNLLFRASAPAAELEQELEEALRVRFAISVPVIVRTAEEWAGYRRQNPFREAADAEPNRVLLALSKAALEPEAVARLRERASAGEAIERIGDAIWIHYGGGVGASKLSPGLLDRLAGSPVTTRNWRTVLKLGELTGIVHG